MLIISITISAQKDVTKFLGIPVDGFKSEMKQKLIAKGYTLKRDGNDEYLKGEFNGSDVTIHIVTNNNKVCRIMVSETNLTDVANIKIRFNRLVNQFENNKKYGYFDNQSIPEEEDISYNMSISKKIYEAVFYQKPDESKLDSTYIENVLKEKLLEKYTEKQLQEPTEEMQEDIKNIAANLFLDIVSKKSVWFRIYDLYGKYYIALYYDNEYNRANGEDL